MRTPPLAAAVLLVALLPLSGRADDSRFVVHEWGTFTSMQGSDGGGLEGLQHEEERLPDFVYSRTEVRECPLRGVGYKGLEVPVTHVTQKMETPVLYFHTRLPRRVRVRVDFVEGLISQWYPVTDLLGPPEGAESDGPLDLATIGRSFLEWEVDLVPRSEPRPDEIPEVPADDPWAYARETSAAWVRTVPRDGEARLGPTEAEHYLFYRGLGRFTLPVAVEARAGGRGLVRNAGDLPIGAACVLEVAPDGRVRWQRLGPVPAGAEPAFALGERPWETGPERIQAVLEKELLGKGLHADEARAMVRTWSRSWFASEGARLMYILPRAWTDAMLPLRIRPEPDRVVRVLVGRLEFLTPETEAEVEAALVGRLDADPATRAGAEARLDRLGRFLEPHVRRVLARTEDADVRRSGDEILGALMAR
jgi:hypothetical protein